MSVQGIDERKISVNYYFITVAWALIQVIQYFVFFQLSHETLHTPQLYALTSFSFPFFIMRNNLYELLRKQNTK